MSEEDITSVDIMSDTDIRQKLIEILPSPLESQIGIDKYGRIVPNKVEETFPKTEPNQKNGNNSTMQKQNRSFNFPEEETNENEGNSGILQNTFRYTVRKLVSQIKRFNLGLISDPADHKKINFDVLKNHLRENVQTDSQDNESDSETDLISESSASDLNFTKINPDDIKSPRYPIRISSSKTNEDIMPEKLNWKTFHHKNIERDDEILEDAVENEKDEKRTTFESTDSAILLDLVKDYLEFHASNEMNLSKTVKEEVQFPPADKSAIPNKGREWKASKFGKNYSHSSKRENIMYQRPVAHFKTYKTNYVQTKLTKGTNFEDDIQPIRRDAPQSQSFKKTIGKIQKRVSINDPKTDNWKEEENLKYLTEKLLNITKRTLGDDGKKELAVTESFSHTNSEKMESVWNTEYLENLRNTIASSRPATFIERTYPIQTKFSQFPKENNIAEGGVKAEFQKDFPSIQNITKVKASPSCGLSKGGGGASCPLQGQKKSSNSCNGCPLSIERYNFNSSNTNCYNINHIINLISYSILCLISVICFNQFYSDCSTTIFLSAFFLSFAIYAALNIMEAYYSIIFNWPKFRPHPYGFLLMMAVVVPSLTADFWLSQMRCAKGLGYLFPILSLLPFFLKNCMAEYALFGITAVCLAIFALLCCLFQSFMGTLAIIVYLTAYAVCCGDLPGCKDSEVQTLINVLHSIFIILIAMSVSQR